jgi:hypothetical protein
MPDLLKAEPCDGRFLAEMSSEEAAMRRTASLLGRGRAATFSRHLVIIVTAVATGIVVIVSQAGATATAQHGASRTQAQTSDAMAGPSPLVTLAERRANVRVQTSASQLEINARQLRLQGTRMTAVKRRLPGGIVLGPNGAVIGGLRPRPAATASDVWFPQSTDSWLTDPAGGVVAAISEAPPAPYDQVPAPDDSCFHDYARRHIFPSHRLARIGQWPGQLGWHPGQ